MEGSVVRYPLRRFNGLTPHYACLSLWNNLRFIIPRKRHDRAGRAALLHLQFGWQFSPPSLQSLAAVIISRDGDLVVNGGTRVVEELHKRGVEAQIGRLTLDPFRGLVAKNVRIFDYRNRENTLARISEVSLDINYAALIHHEPFLNALDVRDAQITFPIKTAEGKANRAQLTNLRAHIYFPPEQIYVSQAEGIFCGIRSVSKRTINQARRLPAVGISHTGRMAKAIVACPACRD